MNKYGCVASSMDRENMASSMDRENVSADWFSSAHVTKVCPPASFDHRYRPPRLRTQWSPFFPDFLILATFLKIDFTFWEQFWTHSKIGQKVESLHQPLPPPHTCTASPIFFFFFWTSCSTVVHLLESVNLHQYIIITQSPWFTSGVTLCVVHSMGFEKCVIIHHRSTPTLNIFCALPYSSFPATQPLETWYFLLSP